ncbi:MAG: hypothetical protein R2853_16145 [Thermomicrobiales bacterium]
MTECQGCGAWNERRRALCVLCGTLLAETDEWDAAAELPPLPPLPDGGLSITMPAWLRAVPTIPDPPDPLAGHEPSAPDVLAADAVPVASTPPAAGPAEALAGPAAPASAHEPEAPDAEPAELPLGPYADPRTFLRDADFPRWIRDLPTLPARTVPPATLAPPAAEPTLVAPPEDPHPLRPPGPGPTPDLREPSPPGQDTAADAAGSAPAPARPPVVPDATASATAQRRAAWETPLLVVLVVGVVVAVIWALLVNGLIGGGA